MLPLDVQRETIAFRLTFKGENAPTSEFESEQKFSVPLNYFK